MIKAVNLEKKFARQENNAVDNLSFNAEKGKITALLGENGAGKTTVLRIIACLLQPDKGTCTAGSFDVAKNPGEARKLVSLVCGGETGLYERLSARENLHYFAELYNADRHQISSMISDISDILDMNSFIDRKCSLLSRGMKQKTALARAVVHNPSIILLDEPSSGLDPGSLKTVHDFLVFCKTRGKTILFSSHNISEVKKLSDMVIIIHKGKLAARGTADMLESEYNKDLESIFLDLTSGKNNHV